MRQLARDVWQLAGFPPHAINAYLVGDVLIDAATRLHRRSYLKQLAGHSLSLVALTHCHGDHQGLAKLLCEQYSIPLACHADDVPAMEGVEPMQPPTRAIRFFQRLWAGPPFPVTRVFTDGDMVAG